MKSKGDEVMERSFDEVLEDFGRGRQRLAERVRALLRELRKEIGCDRCASLVIAEKLTTRLGLEARRDVQAWCSDVGAVLESLYETAAMARTPGQCKGDEPKGAFDLSELVAIIHVTRCFSAAMQLTESADGAAALVWRLVATEILKDWSDSEACGRFADQEGPNE